MWSCWKDLLTPLCAFLTSPSSVLMLYTFALKPTTKKKYYTFHMGGVILTDKFKYTSILKLWFEPSWSHVVFSTVEMMIGGEIGEFHHRIATENIPRVSSAPSLLLYLITKTKKRVSQVRWTEYLLLPICVGKKKSCFGTNPSLSK